MQPPCGGIKGLARPSTDMEREPECEFPDCKRFYCHLLTSPEQGDESCRARAHPIDSLRWGAGWRPQAHCPLWQPLASCGYQTLEMWLVPTEMCFKCNHKFLLFIAVQLRPTLQPHGPQCTRLPCPSPSPRAGSNSCPLSLRCHPTISSSAARFSCRQSFPASGSFPVKRLRLGKRISIIFILTPG